MGLFSFFRRWWTRPDLSGQKIEFAFFGLGNPGEQYKLTRHNIGFRVIDAYLETLTDKNPVTCTDADIMLAKTSGGISVAAVKPRTFMNRSGFAVQATIDRWKIAPERCLVVVDDFHLSLGTMRVRRNGSDGGHNGLKSIIGQIGPDFPRLRIGIGPLPSKTGIIDFVLGNFTETEEQEIAGIQNKGIELLTNFTADTIDAVMNKYN